MIVFRVDGDHEIGLGHVYRCLSISFALRGCDRISFAMHSGSSRSFELVTNQGFDVWEINSNAELIEKLSGEEVVVLDGYNFSFELLQQILVRSRLALVIDDFQLSVPRGYKILNQSPIARLDDYLGHDTSDLYLGLDYLLLRDSFYSEPIRPLDYSKNDLLICFGGSDPFNYSHRVIECLEGWSEEKSLSVILGIGYEYETSLRAKLNETGRRFEIHRDLSASQMVEQIDKSKMAVVSASGIMLEVISRQRPVVAVMTAENQRGLLSGICEMGLAMGIDHFSDQVFIKHLTKLDLSEELQKEMIQAQSRALDGMASDRLHNLLCHEN